jgi:hypothetical protein
VAWNVIALRQLCILKIFYISCCLLLVGETAIAQNVTRKTLRVDNKNCSYYLLEPTIPMRGILLLLPGRGESAKEVFKKTELPTLLKAKGYMTIVPELPYSLFANELIKKQIREIVKTHAGTGNPTLSLGGFSAGGSVAVSYAEYLLSLDSATNLKNIFVIDPPLDLERLYAASERFMEYNCNIMRDEGLQMSTYLDKVLGGSPKDKHENYLALSPFIATESDGGNAKRLKNIPIRLYTEPDLGLVQNRYCKELTLEDLNVTDLENLRRVLKMSGNTNCEYVVTKDRGYHSWNIAEPRDLVAWIVRFGKL